jgi:2-polyprenyl-6-methoxyphenol hydroxylase-like FAD-dependent oxidoreductase
MNITTHQVLVAGAGPTGLMLAGELALAGVDVAIVERRPDQALAGRRAGGLHARTLEVLDQRGIVERFLSEGQRAQATGFASVKLDLTGFPTRHPYSLGLWQNHIERILAAWVAELGVPILRGREVTGVAQDGTGVDVTLSNGAILRGDYLAGCDGGRSVVRKAAGIAFPGWDATTSSLIAEVELTGTPEQGVHHSPLGMYAFGRREYEIRDGEVVYGDTGPMGVMVPERDPGAKGEPTLEDLKAAMVAVCGTDYGAHDPTFLSRFTDATRQAGTYRAGRILLAGDAAHIHSPVGGQGLNTGVQDAVNLGWKLAQVVKGVSPDTLLDSYHAERHPVAARVLRHTMAQVALLRQDERTQALREVVAGLLGMDEPRRRFTGMMSGLDIRYDFGEGHPLLGLRMPDLDLSTADGPLRVYALLHEARPVLLDLGIPGGLDAGPWTGRVRLVAATHAGPWELPVIGNIDAPGAVLIRPDGHVAWVGAERVDRRSSDAGLAAALAAWCGPA